MHKLDVSSKEIWNWHECKIVFSFFLKPTQISIQNFTNVLQKLGHGATFPGMPDELWNVEDRRHNHESRRDPLVISLVDSLFIPLLCANAVVHDILSNSSAQVLSNYVASFDPASGLDLFRVFLEARVDMAFDGCTEIKQAWWLASRAINNTA